jgi:hypothetical protein
MRGLAVFSVTQMIMMMSARLFFLQKKIDVDTKREKERKKERNELHS